MSGPKTQDCKPNRKGGNQRVGKPFYCQKHKNRFAEVKKLWDIVRDKLTTTIIDDANTRITPDLKTAEKHFKALFETRNDLCGQLEYAGRSKCTLPPEFTPDEKKRVITRCRLRRASVPDGLHPVSLKRALKRVVERELAIVLVEVRFRKEPIFQCEHRTVLIPKAGATPEDMATWRPITVDNLLLRVFCSAIAKGLSCSMPINENQRGLAPCDGIGENNFLFACLFRDGNVSTPETAIVLLDFTRVFDSVGHVHLFAALDRLGLCKAYQIIFRFLYSTSITMVSPDRSCSLSQPLEDQLFLSPSPEKQDAPEVVTLSDSPAAKDPVYPPEWASIILGALNGPPRVKAFPSLSLVNESPLKCHYCEKVTGSSNTSSYVRNLSNAIGVSSTSSATPPEPRPYLPCAECNFLAKIRKGLRFHRYRQDAIEIAKRSTTKSQENELAFSAQDASRTSPPSSGAITQNPPDRAGCSSSINASSLPSPTQRVVQSPAISPEGSFPRQGSFCTPAPTSIPSESCRAGKSLNILFSIEGCLSCSEPDCSDSFVSKSWNSMKGNLLRLFRREHSIQIEATYFWSIQGDHVEHRVLAFVDDLCLLASKPDELQENLYPVQSQLAAIGLQLNPMKSVSLDFAGCTPVGVRHKCFRLGSTAISPLKEGDFTKFLGRPVGFHAWPDYNNLNDLSSIGAKILSSAFSLWQRMEALKSFFPAPQFSMRTAQFQKTAWQALDSTIRCEIKNTLGLPNNASNEYHYGHKNKGSCCIPIATEERDLNRIDTAFILLTSSDEEILHLAVEDLRQTIVHRLKLPTFSDANLKEFLLGVTEVAFSTSDNAYSNVWTCARLASRRHGVVWEFDGGVPRIKFNALAIRASGKAMECVAQSPASSHFIADGMYTRFAAWRFIHRARLNLLPLNGSQVWKAKICRRCTEADIETLPHVLNHCKDRSRCWQLRHDTIVARLKKALATRCTIISENQSVGPDNLRPDLMVQSGKKSLFWMSQYHLKIEWRDLRRLNASNTKNMQVFSLSIPQMEKDKSPVSRDKRAGIYSKVIYYHQNGALKNGNSTK
ncbi:Retrovirus-related Pol polyprotein type-1 like protein [Argiope bruennichi]|uniref:Retrovirus-related Pol polyprotein type-1 like protein n=1 Tax=Argiope bruennichi TaxID=94029 RepID=A0A8T0FE37_ARGBR|nr:Retrovirus-related Pol polyprotein type-1 like protein [Argiope bruennichi]